MDLFTRPALPALALTFAALMPLAGAQTATPLGILSQRAGATGTELALDGRAPFHVTQGAVSGMRLLRLDNSATVVALWKETLPGGDVRSYYAISLNGVHFATVRETDYVVQLRRDTFDPLIRTPDFSASVLAPATNLWVVQFQTQPLEEYRQALIAAGATIYDYVAGHCYIVNMDAVVKSTVEALPFVRWVGSCHPEFRIGADVLQSIHTGAIPATARYNVVVFERGWAQKQAVADRIVAMGGTIDVIYEEGMRFEATMSVETLMAVAALDDVSTIDAWGAPENDMDIARQISGATYLEPLGVGVPFDGTGVRAEVMDGGVQFSHPEFAATPVIAHGVVTNDSHGTSTCGQIFADGVNPQAKGILHNGQPIMADYGSVVNRPAHSAELVDPNLSYQAVFQSNSWGDPVTTAYNSKSQEIDQIIFDTDLLILNSQSNTNNQNSRPQAWGKNVVSVGGVDHVNTLSKTDDNVSGASFGPAADGRIKPDLLHFYDQIFTTTTTSTYTTGFGGTSGATPITAGYCGLIFQMWQQQVFNNPIPVPGGTVIETRPHSTPVTALATTTASQYNWLAGGAAAGLTRVKQGWGMIDVKTLYDIRDNMFIVNETDVIANLQTQSYTINVLAGEPALRVTMVYLDPAGTTSAAIHRKNDLDLKVTSPGGTVYWGNNGMLASLWTTSGGSANTKDTVENVFVQNPASGDWTVEVIGSDINTDAHVETGGVDADFALVVTGGKSSSCAAPTPYCSGKFASPGCLPTIGYVGTASASAGIGFTVNGTAMVNNKSCLLFYGVSGQASTPFQGGTLCVATPIKRTPGINTGGNPPPNDCSGVASIDMNLFAVGGLGGAPLAALQVAGTVVDCQWWGRDPGFAAPDNTQLSNGLEYTICP
jgi:hypothetical protein